MVRFKYFIILSGLIVALMVSIGSYIPRVEESENIMIYDISNLNNVKIVKAYAIYPSIMYKSLTYQKLLSERDLIAIVEISYPIKTYHVIEKNFYFTLYKAKVIKVIKGPKNISEIYLYQIGGYKPERNVFWTLEGLPVFKPGEKWLLFMKKMTYEMNAKINLPPNTYHAGGLEAIKVINGRVYSMDNFEKIAEIVLPEQLKVKGIQLQEFINSTLTKP